jgi:hypothetical protein
MAPIGLLLTLLIPETAQKSLGEVSGEFTLAGLPSRMAAGLAPA